MSASVTGSTPALAPYEAISRPVLGWLALLYAVLGYIGLHFDDGSGLVSAVWPASGLAAATVLRHGAPGFWVPALGNLILMLPVSMIYGQPFTVALAIAIGCAAANTGEAWLILRLSGGYGPQRLHDSRAFIRFAAVAAPLGSLFSAVVGIATLVTLSVKAELGPLVRMALWWSGDMVGCLLLTPLLLTWSERPREWRLLREFLLLVAVAAAYLYLLLTPTFDDSGWRVLIAPIGLPLLFWAVARLRLFHLTAFLVSVGLVFVLAHYHELGPFQLPTPLRSHWALQSFLVVLLSSTVLAATLVRERRHLHQQLQHANEALERQVQERTDAITRQRNRLQEIVAMLPLHLSVRDRQGQARIGNRAIALIADQEPDWLQAARELALQRGEPVRDVFGSIRTPRGNALHLQAQVVPLREDAEQSVLVVVQDITERVRRQRLEQLHATVLQRLAGESSLSAVLQQIVLTVEELEPTVIATILLVDRQRHVVRHGAAGRMPEFFCKAIDGASYGPGVGSCGNTAATGQRTITEDIANDPFWIPFKALAAQAGVAACWSEPVRDNSGQVLATFALYAREPARPTASQLLLIEAMAALVRLTIEHHHNLQHLRLLSRAIEQTASAVILCDAGGNIEYANASFTYMLLQPSERARGQSVFDVLLPDDEDGLLVRGAIQQVVGKGSGWHGEFVGRRSDESRIWLHASISPMFSADGQLEKLVTVLEDISSFKQAQANVEYLAFHDPLTGLANRRLLLLRLDEAVRRRRRTGGMSALLFFDLDEFKRINDTLGHEAGDDLLKQIANRLLSNVREDDLVARLGGDEFCLLLSNLHDSLEAGNLARKLMPIMAAPMQLGDHSISVSCSVGITLLPVDGDQPDVLLRNADLAMYQAKSEGKNRFVFFSPEMNDVSRVRLQRESELRRALGRNQFKLFYQPIVNMPDGQLRGMEVLLRWQHPDEGLLSPDAFIDVAEHTGLIVPIGEEVLAKALSDLPQLRQRGDGLRLSVNVSARQLRELEFADRVVALMQQHQVPPGQLQLEITESLLLERSAVTEHNLEGLVRAGARIVIDDFGTGYTSFSQLRELPIHGIKLDRLFVRELPGNEDDAAIVAALIAMAKQLQLDIVAEGVETEAQRDFLVAHGCPSGQGWLFGRPKPL